MNTGKENIIVSCVVMPRGKRLQGEAWLAVAAKQVIGMRPSEVVGRQAHGRALHWT
jgi:hypothetical protein